MAIYQFQNENKNNTNTGKIVGITLLAISSFAFLFLFTNLIPFMKSFLLGILGLFAYPLFITTFIISIALINNKKYVLSKRYIVFLSLATVCLLGIIQLIVLGKPEIDFFKYLGLCYNYKLTAGGILIGLVTAPLIYVLDLLGAYIILALGLIVFVALVIDYLYFVQNNAKNYSGVTIKTKKVVEEKPVKVEILPPQSNNLQKEKVKITLDAKIEEENNQEIKDEENQAKIKLGLIEGNLKPRKPEKKPENVYEYILTPPKVDMSAYSYTRNRENKNQEINNNFSKLKQEENFVDMSNANQSKPAVIVHDETPDFVRNNRPSPAYIEPLEELKEEIQEESIHEVENDDFTDEVLKNILDDKKPIVINPEPIAPQLSRRRFSQLEMEGIKPKTSEEKPAKIYSKPPTYIKPPLELLTTSSVDLSTLNEDVVGKRMQLENALDMFGIPAKVIGVVVGPSVTRYELEMPPGISVKKIIAHSDDIALALAAKGDIRIEAPIPGKSAVGIEVPNEKIATVSMKEILNSPEFINSKSPLTFALGKDITGAVKVCNLQKMPHLLVAGATNSGKSVCLNAIIISLIYKSSPDDVKLILVDPKRVEFSLYNSLPHLLLPNVITEAEKAINAFTWAVNEMERRFEIFMEHRVRNLDEYNELEAVRKCEAEKLPFIVIIVDELADLMMTTKKEMGLEDKIMRLAQKARACGIHLILATQRPSVNVITGTIKANFPSRITFSVTSFQDSRTILDQGGAEKLLGKGDMLYAPSDAAEPKRIQGCFVSGSEVENIVNFVKENNPIEFDEKTANEINNTQKANHQGDSENSSDAFDSLMPDALKLVIEMGQASISLIQRRLVVGYPRAARIIDQMEKANFISPSDGSKPRTVYLTMEKYEELFGNKND